MTFQVRPGLSPLKRNLREQLVEHIGGDIVQGRMKPGDPLPNEEALLNRYAVSRTLRKAGFEVIEGATGQEALKRLQEDPDLVILVAGA